MTEEKLKSMVRELMDDSRKRMENNLEKLILSGALDIESATNWRLPKNIYVALLMNEERQYWPVKFSSSYKKDMKEIKNLYLFV